MGKGASLITTGLQKSFYAEVHSPNSARHHAKALPRTYIPLFSDPTVVTAPLRCTLHCLEQFTLH